MVTNRPCTERTDATLNLRRGPGMVVLSPERHVLYMDPGLSELIQQMNAAEQGTGPSSTRERVLPKELNELCRKIIDALRIKTEAEDWSPVEITRMAPTTPLILVRGFGLPHADGIQHARVVVLVKQLRCVGIPDPEHAKRRFRLSGQEEAIIGCLVKVMTNKEIAAALDTTEETITAWIKHIVQKTGAPTRKGMLAKIRRKRHLATKKVSTVTPKRR